jgi:hypothetical protein
MLGEPSSTDPVKVSGSLVPCGQGTRCYVGPEASGTEPPPLNSWLYRGDLFLEVDVAYGQKRKGGPPAGYAGGCRWEPLPHL